MLVFGPGHVELLGGRGAGTKAQVARGGPIALEVIVRAGEARDRAGGGEDAVPQVAQGPAQVVLALVEMLEQVAQEQVEVDAGELLGEHGGGRGVGHGAGEGLSLIHI